jgi:hypothetical protein
MSKLMLDKSHFAFFDMAYQVSQSVMRCVLAAVACVSCVPCNGKGALADAGKEPLHALWHGIPDEPEPALLS